MNAWKLHKTCEDKRDLIDLTGKGHDQIIQKLLCASLNKLVNTLRKHSFA